MFIKNVLLLWSRNWHNNCQIKRSLRSGCYYMSTLESSVKNKRRKKQKFSIDIKIGEPHVALIKHVENLNKLFDKSKDEIELTTRCIDYRHKNKPLVTQRSAEDLEIEEKELLLRNREEHNLLEQYEINIKRKVMPIYRMRRRILSAVEDSQVVIITGSTGCGKSTQVPQYLLERGLGNGNLSSTNVICTQPRVLAATSLAERIAEERRERIGDRIGYRVRHESRPPNDHGGVTFVTLGVMLKMMSFSQITDNVSHVIIDEAHEPDIQTDLLLLLLKQTLSRSSLKLIIMSATLKADSFLEYFSSFKPAYLNIPGKSFPVKHLYLYNIYRVLENSANPYVRSIMSCSLEIKHTKKFFDNLNNLPNRRGVSVLKSPHKEEIEKRYGAKSISYDLISMIIFDIAHREMNADSRLSILVFLPGLFEILRMKERFLTFFQGESTGLDESLFDIHLLHSLVPFTAQRQCFSSVRAGRTKIIFSSSIAETSITITDITHVIDSCKVKEKRLNNLSQVASLALINVSKANIKQRAGRCGRLRPGTYYCLFSKRFVDALSDDPTPDVYNSNLDDVLLHLKINTNKDESIFDQSAQMINRPDENAILAAFKHLHSLAAFDKESQSNPFFKHNASVDLGDLTPIGYAISQIPTSASFARMLILAIYFRCLDPLLTAIAIIEHNPFDDILVDKNPSILTRSRYAQGLAKDSELLSTVKAIYYFLSKFKTVDGSSVMNPKQELEENPKLEAELVDSGMNFAALKTIVATKQSLKLSLVNCGLIPRHTLFEHYNWFDGINKDPSLRGSSEINFEENSGNYNLLKGLLTFAFSPNIAKSSFKYTQTSSHTDFVNSHKRIKGLVTRHSDSTVLYNSIFLKQHHLIDKEEIVTFPVLSCTEQQFYVQGNITKIDASHVLLFSRDVAQEATSLTHHDGKDIGPSANTNFVLTDGFFRLQMKSKAELDCFLSLNRLIKKALLITASQPVYSGDNRATYEAVVDDEPSNGSSPPQDFFHSVSTGTPQPSLDPLLTQLRDTVLMVLNKSPEISTVIPPSSSSTFSEAGAGSTALSLSTQSSPSSPKSSSTSTSTSPISSLSTSKPKSTSSPLLKLSQSKKL